MQLEDIQQSGVCSPLVSVRISRIWSCISTNKNVYNQNEFC